MAYVHTRIFEYLVCARDRERACVCVRAARRAARRHTHDTHRPRAPAGTRMDIRKWPQFV